MIGPRGKVSFDSPETFFDLEADEVCENPPPDPDGELFQLPNQKPVPFELRVREDYARWRDERGEIKVLSREQRASVAEVILANVEGAASTKALPAGAAEVAVAKTLLNLTKNDKRPW